MNTSSDNTQKNTKEKILIAEDEKDLREALHATLKAEGFEVYTAEDGEQTIALAFEHKPDLILLDIIMPNKGGMQVLEELRADTWGKDVKVIILTAVDSVDYVSEAVNLRGLDYLVKTDWKLEDVVKRIKERLNE